MYGLGIAKGFMVTLRCLFRKPFTVQYPEEKLPLPKRFRGYEFAWYRENCTACGTCAKACPHGVISVLTEEEVEGTPYPEKWFEQPLAEKTYNLQWFEIDLGRCIFCGLCAQSCPFQALFMGSKYELAAYKRWDLISNQDQLTAQEKAPSDFVEATFLKKLTAEKAP